jgi:hypothetical protein
MPVDHRELCDGDQVLVTGTVIIPTMETLIVFDPEQPAIFASGCHIHSIEVASFNVGDPVRVVQHKGAPWDGTIIAEHDGFFWVVPLGFGQPCTATRDELRRRVEPKSADVERLVPRNVEAAE